MTAKWTCDAREKARRLVDLALVSVLLDAGAGPKWTYKEPDTLQVFSRSEGLGVASLHMFLSGAFSSDKVHEPHRVDAEALINLPDDAIAKAFQVQDKTNPLVGCAGRTELLQRLGHSLQAHPEFFGPPPSSFTTKEDDDKKPKKSQEVLRPGHLVDFLFARATTNHEISIQELWKVVIYGLETIWPPSRTKLHGHNMGDVWELPYLQVVDPKAQRFVSFHKLSQWLTYSLMEPLQEAGLTLTELQLMTGLPEYRNGGLLVDFGVLVPKQPATLTTTFEPSDPVIIEWRALTVALLDELHKRLLTRLDLTADEFPLVKMLEGGSWKAGRVLAKEKRPDGSPPITIKSDGTVF